MPSILTVIGARPQFVKAAVVSRALQRAGLGEQILHTGQHYDDAMSGQFLRDLGIDGITRNLAVGSGSHAEQTARMMTGIAAHIEAMPLPPRVMLVYGDTNSTLAASLVASKIGMPVAHVEAGLRSYNRAMPEEVNRVLTDHLSARLYATSPVAVENLAREGLTYGVQDVGDVMLDAFHTFQEAARTQIDLAKVAPDVARGYGLVTIHRPSNTDDPTRLQLILDELGRLDRQILWPVHPRNTSQLAALRLPDNLTMIEPASYFTMLMLLEAASVVITDSGGLQKEAYWAKRPCITLRAETEWVETLDGGWNQLADLGKRPLRDWVEAVPSGPWSALYGDGHASDRVAADLAKLVETAA